jgi:hypothetical protein
MLLMFSVRPAFGAKIAEGFRRRDATAKRLARQGGTSPNFVAKAVISVHFAP